MGSFYPQTYVSILWKTYWGIPIYLNMCFFMFKFLLLPWNTNNSEKVEC